MAAVVVSAPGKVLITGGYLVLEQPNSGLVLSTSARFYAIVKPMHESLADDSWSWSWSDVKVISPQLFKETAYKMSLRDFSLKKVTSPSEGGNPFVENAVQMAIAVAAARAAANDQNAGKKLVNSFLLQGLEITILGNNAFYSFRKKIEMEQLPLTAETLASLPEFSAITLNPSEVSKDATNTITLPEVAKTGLGSSAAMTAAVVASVLEYLGCVKLPQHGSVVVDDPERRQTLDLVHAVSQAAHCAAQGKIGSGFDISSAVYGSQRYIRFSPSILSSKESSKGKNLLSRVKQLLLEEWDGERIEYALPPRLMLIVGEPGYGGSHTPSMVGAVLAWRKQDPQHADIVWSGLAKANQRVESGLLRLNYLAQADKESYLGILNLCSTRSVDKWETVSESRPEGKEVVEALLETRKGFELVRSGLQRMGEAAGVPIEPPVQTQLLDQTMSMDGVLFAGVPGAGGFDAVFAITLGELAKDRVEQEWSRKGVLSLPINEDPCGVSSEVHDPHTGELVSALQEMNIQ